jgi:hypothetical protein
VSQGRIDRVGGLGWLHSGVLQSGCKAYLLLVDFEVQKYIFMKQVLSGGSFMLCGVDVTILHRPEALLEFMSLITP